MGRRITHNNFYFYLDLPRGAIDAVSMIPKMRWELRPVPPPGIETGHYPDYVAPLVSRLLWQRGITTAEQADNFLLPKLRQLSNPFEMAEMEIAVERVFQAIDNEEEICLYGDYDVDGVTSVTLLRSILRAYDTAPRHFIPIRSREGYGLSKAGIARCLSEGNRPSLLITVDCGTSSVEEVRWLKEEGIDVIILDHHEASPEGRPPAVAVINPKLEGSELSYLCSAGVVFKLIHALLKIRKLPDYELRDYLDLVAVATVADIVPLVAENRLLVRHGIRQLSASRHAGLQMLMEVAGIQSQMNAANVGFRIGPRINAAGRMDSPLDALELLTTHSRERASILAKQLDTHNKRRQEEEANIKTQAVQHLSENFNPEKDDVIVLGSRSWHPGVVGIVASQLMRLYHKPTFVISFDEKGIGKGSGRSIHGVSLVKTIQACKNTLISGGGHDMAAGLVIHEDSLDDFRKAFDIYVKETTTPEQREPLLYIDAEVNFEDLTLELLESYELLEPFGNANPQPIFMCRNVHLTESPRRLNGNHIKLFLRQGFIERDAVFFGGADYILPEPPWDIAFTIDRNVFRGRTSLSISIQAVRKTRPV